MAGKKIGLILALDGEKEFNTAATACNKSIRQLNSEMKLVKEESRGQANTLDTLQKKHRILADILEEHKKKEEAVAQGLDHAKENYRSVGEQLDKYEKELSEAETALHAMRESGTASEKEMEDQEKAVQHLKDGIAEGRVIYEKAGNSIKDWETKLNNAKAQTIKANAALETNATYLKEAKNSADGCAQSIDAFGKQTKANTEVTLKWKDALKAAVATEVVDNIQNLLVTGVKHATESTLELQDAQAQLQASTGASAAQMRDYNSVMKELYEANYGDSMESIGSAMAMIAQYTHETDPQVIKELAENAITLEDVFDMDLSESIRGVDALMKNMHVDAKTAFDLIVTGAQNGLDKSHELTDNLAEYSSLWGQAGFSAEQMFTILQNGLDAGAYNLDKVNDFVKEFTISLADGRIEESLDSFSAGTKNLFYQWKAGQATASQVFYSVINDLDTMTNKQEALTIASNTWSALGEDNAMAVITALNDVNDTYSQVQGAAERLKEVKYDTLRSEYAEVGRTFQQEILVPVLEDFLPKAQTGLKLLVDNTDKIIPVATAAGTAMAGMLVVKEAKKHADAISSIKAVITALTMTTTAQTAAKTAETAADAASTVAKGVNTAATAAQTVATEGATAAQTKLNLVMKGNPYLVVAAALGTLAVAAATYTKRAGEASKEAQLLADANDRVCASANEVADATNSTISSYQDSTAQMQAQGQYASILADKITNLAGKQSLSNAEQQVMKGYISELNELVPNLNLSYDSQAKALNKTNEEINKHIKLSQKELEIQSAQEYATELLKQRSKLEIEAIKLKNESASLQKETNKLLEDENEIILSSPLDAFLRGKSDEAKTYKELTEAQEANSTSMADNEAAMESLGEELSAVQTYLADMGISLRTETEALDENTAAQNANADAAGNNAGAQADASAAMVAAAQGIADTYTGMQKTVSDVLESQMNMFEEFSVGTQLSTSKLLENMQSQIDGVTNWADNIASLSDRAINQDLLTYLAEMGPEGAGYVATFAQMTDAELQRASDMWTESLDMKSGVQENVACMLEAYTTALHGGAEQVAQATAQIGDGTVQGLVNAITEGLPTATASGQELGKATTDGVAEGAQTHSPSKATYETGQNVAAGLALGVQEGKAAVLEAGRGVSQELVSSMAESLSTESFRQYGSSAFQSLTSGIMSRKSAALKAAKDIGTGIQKEVTTKTQRPYYVTAGQRVPGGLTQGINAGKPAAVQAASSMASDVKTAASNIGSLYSVGYNVSAGLASGIRAGQSTVINAVAAVCAAAVRQAKSSLRIHSPSKVFEELGSYTAEGFGIGYEGKMSDVNAAIRESMDYGFEGAAGSSRKQAEEQGDIRIVLEQPIYAGNTYTKTEITEFVIDGITRRQAGRRAAKGVYAGG